AGLRIARGIEAEPVAGSHAAVPLRPEIGPGLGQGEVDVEQDRPHAHGRNSDDGNRSSGETTCGSTRREAERATASRNEEGGGTRGNHGFPRDTPRLSHAVAAEAELRPARGQATHNQSQRTRKGHAGEPWAPPRHISTVARGRGRSRASPGERPSKQSQSQRRRRGPAGEPWVPP